MGCGASQSAVLSERSQQYVVQISETWGVALSTVRAPRRKMADSLVCTRSGWKTVRVFVSSTFRDFHAEREHLVKKVFPDLRAWCELRKLYLVECDLRWGVPSDFSMEATLRACLGEIDRCYHDNQMPFFLNMTSERVGWVPGEGEVPEPLRREYDWVDGLSVTEMEIMHGAFRVDNPNALFLMRDNSFLKDAPPEVRKLLVEDSDIAPLKLLALKQHIAKKFPKDRVVRYTAQYQDYDPDNKRVHLDGLDKNFAKTVFEFFQKRIARQYPLQTSGLDVYLQRREQHEAFMKRRCENVIGRADMIKQIDEYICGVGCDVPFLLVGDTGCGKSSIMAKIADIAATKAIEGTIPGAGDSSWLVFYHFVGAVPGSTELLPMLQRLLKELNLATDTSMPSSLDDACQMTCSALANTKTKPTVIVVDALNQYDEEMAAGLVSWVPKKLAPHVRCVFSVIPDTEQHKNLARREPRPTEVAVLPLDEADRKALVEQSLGQYNKRLSEAQMDALLSKSASQYPLWLSIACEELRVFGLFRQISDKINTLPDSLLELEQLVLSRFEEEGGGLLLVATLCLLEVSARGLLEAELLTILGDEDGLTPGRGGDGDGTEKDRGKEKVVGQLPAYKWADIYRALRPFLRPFGDSGEGRLDFYHRSLSKAVRKKYFSSNNEESTYQWWHQKLAQFFQHRCQNIQRKLEELPIHLIAVKNEADMKTFLTDWEVFDQLYSDDYSAKLLEYWRKGSSFEAMEAAYVDKMLNLVNSDKNATEEKVRRYVQMSRFFAQGGRYNRATEFCDQALALEQDKMGGRPLQMADIYWLSAQVKDEVMKMEEYMYRSQLPRMRDIIANFEKALSLFRTQESREVKRKMGNISNRLAFYYSGYVLRGGDAELSADAAKEKATVSVDRAIDLFTELGEDLLIGDAKITKGVCHGPATPPQVKLYNEAEELLLRVGGELHHSLDRLYLNKGIYHEETGDYYAAYACFYRWYCLCRDLYGLTHPKTRRPVNTLREPMYRRIAGEKGNPVPELTDG